MTKSGKYGKPRLYVFDNGSRLGWLDLLTGERTLTDPGRAAELDQAVADYLAEHPRTRVGQPTPALTSGRHAGLAPSAELGAQDPVVPGQRHAHWDDLADTAPGSTLQAKVAELSAAAGEDYPEEATSWLVGAQGEAITAEALAPLARQGWYLINSVTLNSRGTDLDHLLIGPGGVFTLNTKTRPNGRVNVYERALYVNGGKRNHYEYIRAAQREAERVKTILSAGLRWQLPFVVPTLVFVATAKLTVKAHPAPVYVLDVSQALDYFQHIPGVLRLDQVDAIHQLARRSTTWM